MIYCCVELQWDVTVQQWHKRRLHIWFSYRVLTAFAACLHDRADPQPGLNSLWRLPPNKEIKGVASKRASLYILLLFAVIMWCCQCCCCYTESTAAAALLQFTALLVIVIWWWWTYIFVYKLPMCKFVCCVCLTTRFKKERCDEVCNVNTNITVVLWLMRVAHST